jgi:hypothetical protein
MMSIIVRVLYVYRDHRPYDYVNDYMCRIPESI